MRSLDSIESMSLVIEKARRVLHVPNPPSDYAFSHLERSRDGIREFHQGDYRGSRAVRIHGEKPVMIVLRPTVRKDEAVDIEPVSFTQVVSPTGFVSRTDYSLQRN